MIVAKDKETVHSVRLHIEGKVDGKGILDWEGARKTKEISGKVNLDWGGDWYQPECKITYTPVGASSGELRVYYKFGTI